MHADLALHMMSDMLWTALAVCAPVLGLTILVGLVVSILQGQIISDTAGALGHQRG